MQLPPIQDCKRSSPFKGFMPFFWLALAGVGGVLLADILSLPPWVWLTGVCACLGVWALLWVLPESSKLKHLLRNWTHAKRRLPGILLGLVFLLGGWRYAAEQMMLTPEVVAYYNQRGTVQIIGRVVQPPDQRDQVTNLVVQVEALLLPEGDQWQLTSSKVEGRVLVQTAPTQQWAYGDRLQITGEPHTPFEDAAFSYRDYLARKGIYSQISYARIERIDAEQGHPIRAFIYRLRTNGYKTLQVLFPSPESDLLSGILLGLDQGLSPALQSAFRKTGTTHIIAISGFNIAILAGLISAIFTRLLGRKWGTVTSVGAIAGYALMVGGDAAVVRAAIMGAMGVMGGMFGRRQNGLNSLGLAVLGMVLWNPNVPWDIGFQLSVAATLGLVLFAQPLEAWCIQFSTRWVSEETAEGLVGPVSEFFLFTLVAQGMTLPLIAYHFGGVSWIALIANPLILPVQSFVMILGGLALLSGLILPGLGTVMALLALPFVRYTIRMVSWLARLPGGDWVLPDFEVLWLVGFYALFFTLTLATAEQRKKLLTKVVSYQTGLIILAGLVIFTWNRVLALPDGKLHLTFLDVEGTVLIQTPEGAAVLIGGGRSPSHLKQMLDERLTPGDRNLDVIIIGSTAKDDLNGLVGVLNPYRVGKVLWGVDETENQISRTLFSKVAEKDVKIAPLTAGQRMDLGKDAAMEVLYVSEKGAVLWLEWGNFSALLPTGRIDAAWLSIPGAPDVVLLNDGVSPENLPLDRINLWSPSVILLPLAEADLPLQGEHELLGLLEKYPALRVDDQGWVRVSTDGAQLWVSGE